MKKLTTLTLAAATALALTAGSASAQSRWHDGRGQWQSVNQRQAELDRRIDRGVRAGQISRTEAYRLRAEFRDIARLEARYRQNGLSSRERVDLDRRFDRLAMQISREMNDRRYGYGYGYGRR